MHEHVVLHRLQKSSLPAKPKCELSLQYMKWSMGSCLAYGGAGLSAALGEPTLEQKESVRKEEHQRGAAMS